jgi:hypothetical protein
MKADPGKGENDFIREIVRKVPDPMLHPTRLDCPGNDIDRYLTCHRYLSRHSLKWFACIAVQKF